MLLVFGYVVFAFDRNKKNIRLSCTIQLFRFRNSHLQTSSSYAWDFPRGISWFCQKIRFCII